MKRLCFVLVVVLAITSNLYADEIVVRRGESPYLIQTDGNVIVESPMALPLPWDMLYNGILGVDMFGAVFGIRSIDISDIAGCPINLAHSRKHDSIFFLVPNTGELWRISEMEHVIPYGGFGEPCKTGDTAIMGNYIFVAVSGSPSKLRKQSIPERSILAENWDAPNFIYDLHVIHGHLIGVTPDGLYEIDPDTLETRLK